MKILQVKTLSLTNFRNYKQARIEVGDRPVILVGENGAGKTNILEAISLLTPGRGIRRAKLLDIDNAGNAWGINAEIIGINGAATIGTGRAPDSDTDKRLVKIDGKLNRGQAELGKHFACLWLTPQMDNLFIEGGTARRKFLDRLVYSFDSEHASRINAYDFAMRERNKLLQNGVRDAHWFIALENKMSEYGVAIAGARRHTLKYLTDAMELISPSFPHAKIALSGTVEDNNMSAEEFNSSLANNRHIDAGAGRTLIGVHRTQVEVSHIAKNMAAENCSTGEQKALLISIVLAQAKAGATWHKIVPVLLLDEIVSHLDLARRNALFAELTSISAQAWLTGTDAELFAGIDGEIIRVKAGELA